MQRATTQHADAASAVEQSAQKREFFGELESLRGLAALMVVLYHCPNWYPPFFDAWLARNAWVAVEFFFVLSGFVLYHSYAFRIPDAAALKRFALYRLIRLYPVHLTFTMVFFAIEAAKLFGASAGAISPISSASLLRALGENLLLVHGLALAPHQVFLNFPSWSISVEFYTYLIFGMAVWRLTRKGFVLLSCVLIVSCFAVFLALGEGLGEFHHMLCCVAGFFMGSLVRIAYARLGTRKGRVDWTILLLLVSAVALNRYWPPRTVTWLAFPMSAAIILSLVRNPTGSAHALLSWRPFRWLGEISYSLYMCHALVLYLARHALHDGFRSSSLPRAIALYASIHLAVILTGWLTYLLVERPAQRWLRGLARARARETQTS